jgi:hypothetical protein
MLSKEENTFILYWEQNRLRRKKIVRQFLLGIPAGLLLVVPIVINLTSGWYKRAAIEANSQDFNPMVLMVALLLIVGFTAIFWQRHKWDQCEQRYQELLNRRTRDAKATTVDPAGPGSALGAAAPAGPPPAGPDAVAAPAPAVGPSASSAEGSVPDPGVKDSDSVPE